MEVDRPFDADSDTRRAPPRRTAATPPPNQPRRRRPGSETVARVAWALPWIAFAITIIAVGDLLFAAAMVAISWIALIELFRMTRDAPPIAPVALAVSAAMIAAAYWGTHFQIVLAGACAFPLMFFAIAARRDRSGAVYSMAVTAFGIGWLAIPFAHAVLLRELPLHGGALLVDVVIATFVADTAAYAGGRLFGRHQLAPGLSPNKTIEGLALGFVGGTMAFWFAGLYQDWLPGIDALLMGICVAAVGPVGDLFESLVKRDLKVKDSGNVFGPHGGMLDRVDAVLFTVVAGYYLSIAFVY